MQETGAATFAYSCLVDRCEVTRHDHQEPCYEGMIMRKFFKAVEAGVRGAAGSMKPGRFAAAGIQLSCTHCKHAEFERREAQLNTAGMSFLDLDWMNRSGTALVCTNCGLAHWLAIDPVRLD